MKRQLQLIICGSAASVLALTASAQERSLQRTNHSEHSQSQSSSAWRTHPLTDGAKASDIIGTTVQNYQDEKLGKVEDLAVDIQTGRIVQVIVSGGGFMGVGNGWTAVPPGALHYDTDKKVLHLDATKEKLKAGPRFDASKWDDATQSNRVTEVYTYYGERPYYIARPGYTNESGDEITDAQLASTMPRKMDGTINTEAGRTVDRVRNEEIARNAGGNYETNGVRNADGTWTTAARPGPNWARQGLGRVEKASQIIGQSVKNLQDEKLGKVEDMLVSLSSGRIIMVVVSSGGFLGMGDELSAVPPTAFSDSGDTLRLDVSKDSLSNRPHFKSKQWPDFNQPTYVEETYRAYNVQTYPVGKADYDRRDIRTRDGRVDTSKEADNTARNVVDRNDRTLTPMDQGNGQPDLNTTAEIRKQIIANKNMSVNAKNVKIITMNGRVLLRGPVASESEKQIIGEIAERVARPGNVNNQLEAQRTRSSND